MTVANVDDGMVFWVVVVVFPLFGLGVFFWWRWQYGVWAVKRRTSVRDGGGAKPVVLSASSVAWRAPAVGSAGGVGGGERREDGVNEPAR